jgi:hypothetical protein
MSLNLRSIAMRGIGFGPMAMATLGLLEEPVLQQTLSAGGGNWPFVHPKPAKHTAERTRRTRHTRDVDLLFLRYL